MQASRGLQARGPALRHGARPGSAALAPRPGRPGRSQPAVTAPTCALTAPRARELPRRDAPRAPAPRAAPARPARNVAARFGVPATILERSDDLAEALPLPRAVESAADDPLLKNPLQRAERLSTNWFGVIAEYEGVIVDSTLEAHKEAWRRVATEMGMPPPLGSALNRIKGVRDDVVVMQLLTWTRNPAAASKIAARKDEIYDEIMNGNQPAEAPGVRAFLETLHSCKVPVAVASPLPERRVRPALERLGLARSFAGVVTAEDNASPDLELTYLTASGQLQRPPLRCVVVGDSNRSVEAAHELGMKSVVVTGGQPAWNFGGADLVVRSLGQLSFVNLKNLFAQEDLVEPTTPWEEIHKQQEADYEAGLSPAGSGFSGAPRYDMDGSGAGADRSWSMGSGSSFGSDRSSGGAWAPDSGGNGSGNGGAASRELEPAVARGGLGGGQQRQQEQAAAAALGGGASMSMSGEDDEEFDVILPPPGAAFWDMQR